MTPSSGGTPPAAASPAPDAHGTARRSVDVRLLTDAAESCPAVAGWLYEEWYATRGMSLQETQRLLEQRLNRDVPPICAVALREGRGIGTASLLRYEAPAVHPQPRCFLADVYVLPSERGQGVATALCHRMIESARRLGLAELFVMTAGPPLLYKRLGWRIVHQDMPGPRGRSVTMLVLPLNTKIRAAQEANAVVRRH